MNGKESNERKSKCDVKGRVSDKRKEKSKETMLGEKNFLVDAQWSPGRRSGSIVKTERVSYRSLFLVHSLPNIFRIPRRTKDATRIHRSTCLPSTRFIQSYLVFSDISNNLRDFCLEHLLLNTRTREYLSALTYQSIYMNSYLKFR